MAGPFDLITGALGQTNPYDEARTWADEAQRRNRAAVGLDANGNPIAPAADPNNPANNGQSAAMGQNLATGVMQPNQQPQATKTDPSLGHILADMTQYQQREQGFNQAMGAGFAAVSQPRDREWVSHIFNVNEPDATKFVQQQQDLASQQQGQDRMNSLGAMISGPQGLQIATALNMPGSTPAEKIAALQAAYRADPQGVGRMITATQQPTDMMRNANQVATQMKAAGVPQNVIDRTVSLIQTGMLPDVARPMAMSEIAWKRDHPNQPLPWAEGDPASFARYNTTVAAREDQRQEALGKRPGVDAKLGNIERQLDEIEKDPALAGLMEKITPTTGSWSIIASTPAERALAQKIDQLSSEKYVEGLSDPNMGNRKTQTEMTYVGKALSGVLNARNLKLPDFVAGIERLKEQVYETHANAYGESGDFTGMDSKYNGYLNDSYREGPLSEGIKNAPQRKPLDDEAKTYWKNGLAAGKARSTMLHILRTENYDTKDLQ